MAKIRVWLGIEAKRTWYTKPSKKRRTSFKHRFFEMVGLPRDS